MKTKPLPFRWSVVVTLLVIAASTLGRAESVPKRPKPGNPKDATKALVWGGFGQAVWHDSSAGFTMTASLNDLAPAFDSSSSFRMMSSVFIEPEPQACCHGIRGNVNGDAEESINIVDVTYLVGYLFSSGPAPNCPEEANVDADPGGLINIVDVTSLVSYLFNGGEAPFPC